MGGHTEGPWDWQYIKPPHGRLVGRAGHLVLDHATYVGMWLAAYDDATDHANARLIAAAPCLLEALRWVDAMLSEPRKHNATTVQAQVRAAIAKATGEAQ
jgi:hypothetical protein